MSHAAASRLRRAEDALMVGEERQECLKGLRLRYNLRRVPSEVIWVNLLALVGDFDPPQWVITALDRPLPNNLDPKELARLQRKAVTGSDSDDSAEIPGLDKHIKESLYRMSQYTGENFRSPEDVAAWCKGKGRYYRPVDYLIEAIDRLEKGISPYGDSSTSEGRE